MKFKFFCFTIVNGSILNFLNTLFLALKQNENIPKGWAECNGQTVNGIKTPDLRGRFILGVGNLDDLLGNCSLNPLETIIE